MYYIYGVGRKGWLATAIVPGLNDVSLFKSRWTNHASKFYVRKLEKRLSGTTTTTSS